MADEDVRAARREAEAGGVAERRELTLAAIRDQQGFLLLYGEPGLDARPELGDVPVLAQFGRQDTPVELPGMAVALRDLRDLFDVRRMVQEESICVDLGRGLASTGARMLSVRIRPRPDGWTPPRPEDDDYVSPVPHEVFQVLGGTGAGMVRPGRRRPMLMGQAPLQGGGYPLADFAAPGAFGEPVQIGAPMQIPLLPGDMVPQPGLGTGAGPTTLVTSSVAPTVTVTNGATVVGQAPDDAVDPIVQLMAEVAQRIQDGTPREEAMSYMIGSMVTRLPTIGMDRLFASPFARAVYGQLSTGRDIQEIMPALATSILEQYGQRPGMEPLARVLRRVAARAPAAPAGPVGDLGSLAQLGLAVGAGAGARAAQAARGLDGDHGEAPTARKRSKVRVSKAKREKKDAKPRVKVLKGRGR